MKKRIKHNILIILYFVWHHKNLRYIAILLLLTLNTLFFTDFLSYFKNKPNNNEDTGYFFYMPTYEKSRSFRKIENLMARELAENNNMQFVKVWPLPDVELIKIMRDIEFEDHFNAESFEYNILSFFKAIKFKAINGSFEPGLQNVKKNEKANYEKHKKFVRWLSKVKNFKTKFESITPYDALIKKHAKTFGVDWRLIAAQMFIESSYRKNAKSYAGAMGLMQLTPIAMKEMGSKNAWDIEDNIYHGIKYMKSRLDIFKNINGRNRTQFALASYNAGIGHVRDAQRLAKSYGFNPKKWHHSVDEMFLELSDTGHISTQAKHGYVRGNETVNYVKKIMKRYKTYQTLADK